MDNLIVGKRLKEARKDNNLSQEELAKVVGFNKSTIQRYESGKIEKVKLPIVEAIAKCLQVNPSWIVGKSSKKHLDTLPTNAYPAELCRLPVIGKVSAGNGVLAEDNIIGYELADARYGNGEYFLFKVVGDSMSPKIEEGDLVLVHQQDSVDSGNFAVVVVNGEDGFVKKVKYDKEWIELHSINPYYPTRRFDGRDVLQVRVIGKVIELVRKL